MFPYFRDACVLLPYLYRDADTWFSPVSNDAQRSFVLSAGREGISEMHVHCPAFWEHLLLALSSSVPLSEKADGINRE